jgi:bacterioferritin-associated ferredoxin
MIVCLCHGVSSAQLEKVVANGADSVEAVGRHCGAGTDCGSCIGHIEALLDANATDEEPARCSARRLPMANHAA